MAVDAAANIGDFDAAKPPGSDPKSEMDDNLRHIKGVLKSNLPQVKGTVTASHTELSYVTGVTAAIQTQLNAKAALASPAFTGTPTAPTASVGNSTTQLSTTAFVMAAVALATGGTGGLTLTVSNAAAVSLVNGQQDAGFYTSGPITWTLPPSPTVGDETGAMPCNARADNVVACNGQLIMGLAEDMTIGDANEEALLIFVGGSIGWRLKNV